MRRNGLTVVVAVAFVCGGCDGDSAKRRNDFSGAQSVTIQLGDPGKENGSGLQHIYHEKDGITEPTIIDGVACRALRLRDAEVGYLYFSIEPTFKRTGLKKARIDIDYLDVGYGELGLQYDATGQRELPEPAYADVGYTLPTGDSVEWKRASFVVRDAAFKNSQNSHADFRFVVKPPELYVSRVTVSRR